MDNSGKFIVVEGIDRSGKSTLCKNLVKSMEHLSLKKPPILVNYPDRSTKIGELIDCYLKKKVIFNVQTSHLLFSANRWEKDESIKRMLKNHNVICDRYIYSGVAYSVALGADEKWAMSTDRGLLEPDLVLFLNVEPSQICTRNGFGHEIYDDLQLQKKIHFYLKKYCIESKNCVIINGKNSLQDMSVEAVNAVRFLFDNDEYFI